MPSNPTAGGDASKLGFLFHESVNWPRVPWSDCRIKANRVLLTAKIVIYPQNVNLNKCIIGVVVLHNAPRLEG